MTNRYLATFTLGWEFKPVELTLICCMYLDLSEARTEVLSPNCPSDGSSRHDRSVKRPSEESSTCTIALLQNGWNITESETIYLIGSPWEGDHDILPGRHAMYSSDLNTRLQLRCSVRSTK